MRQSESMSLLMLGCAFCPGPWLEKKIDVHILAENKLDTETYLNRQKYTYLPKGRLQ